MIEVRSLSYSYGSNKVLRDVSFCAQSGDVVGILGNNGAGKSTLITCINRIRVPDSGSVYVNGIDFASLSRNDAARTMAYVAQSDDISQISVFDCILMGRKPYIRWGAEKKDIDICHSMIERLGLESFQIRMVDELSGGEKQKVMIARALVQEPSVMLLDEPTAALDPKNQHEVMSFVRYLAKTGNITVLAVLHDLNLALQYCDKFFFMKDGTGFRYGSADIVDERTISEVYGMEAEIVQIRGRKIVIIGRDYE